MAHQVPWCKKYLDIFISEGALNPFEIEIMTTRVYDNMTVTQQALRMNCSKSTVEKCIAKLKLKYDEVQKHNPELPPRKFSAKEVYMDNN